MMAEESIKMHKYDVDLTQVAQSNMVVLPPFNETLKCCVSMDHKVGLMKAPGGEQIIQFKQEEPSIFYCAVPFVQGNGIPQNMEQAPKNFDAIPINNNNNNSNDIIDRNEQCSKLKIEHESSVKCEGGGNVIQPDEIFANQGNPIYFNISACEEFITDLQHNHNQMDNSIQFMSSCVNPQAEEILEQIPNAVDFSHNNQTGSSTNLAANNEQNREGNDCPTPDTISVSSLSAQDINEVGVQFGSYPESIIHQIANNLPRYTDGENCLNESLKASYSPQYQYTSILGQLQIEIPEPKPQGVDVPTKFDYGAAAAVAAAYPQQYYYQHLPCVKSENKPILFEQQQNIGLLAMQQCSSQCCLQQPPPLHYLFQSNNNVQNNAQPFVNNAAAPIGEGNFVPNPFAAFSCSSTPKPLEKLNVTLDPAALTSSKKNPKKAMKRKSREVEQIGADPDVTQYIKILSERLGLPPDYKFDFINGGHGIKNPRFFYDKLSKETILSLRMLSSDSSSNSSSGGENKVYPYVCAICFKSFEMRRLLSRHQKCHSDIKRYLCTFCAKGFNDTFDLKRHTRTHTGVRPYKCSFCEKSFTQRCSLEMHCLKVHNFQHTYKYKERRAKVYVCEECGNTTCKSEAHYMHLKSFHPTSPALLKFYDKRHFKFTDSKFANDLLGKLSTKIQIH